jgi:hypothetical protein
MNTTITTWTLIASIVLAYLRKAVPSGAEPKQVAKAIATVGAPNDQPNDAAGRSEVRQEGQALCRGDLRAALRPDVCGARRGRPAIASGVRREGRISERT